MFHEFLSTPNIYGPESGGVRKDMKLSFHPYKDLLKRTPYVAVASFLVQTVSGIREGNEVQVEDESDFNVYASDAAISSSLGAGRGNGSRHGGTARAAPGDALHDGRGESSAQAARYRPRVAAVHGGAALRGARGTGGR